MSEQIEWSYNEYQEVSVQMYHEQSYIPALKAAILAPSVFLKDLNNFEVTFDIIIHHLEFSMSKANTDSERNQVQRIAQELFHGHIFLIEQKLNYLKALAARSAGQKIKAIFEGNIPEPDFILPAAMIINATTFLSAETAILLGAYFEKLYSQWKISLKSHFFYVQLARTYRKIIASSVYNKDFTLIDNTIDRTKLDIVKGIIALREWDEGVEFMAYLEYRKPFNYSILKGNFYRGYRKYFMIRNILSTYFFFSFIIITSLVLLIWLAFQHLGEGLTAFAIFTIIFLSIFFIRYEHRLIFLKYRIRQRIKEISE